MQSSYRKISNFGNKPYNKNEPLSVCLVDTMDKNFNNASVGHLFGPRTQKCQAFMSQRCANNWDGFCEYFYQENGVNATWPNNQAWPNTANIPTNSIDPVKRSSADHMLHNTAQRKYCTYGNQCPPRCEPFDPTNPDSQMVYYYDNIGADCVPVCRVDAKTVDNDPVMTRILDRPTITPSTIINICNTSKREGNDLSGTRLGGVCDRYFQNINTLR